ncbi:MAG: hypothetical protein IPI08_13660 [Betaproteobacteria bacterium]|nr:hypothetical protein [Betaproteobacteria bacterium]
MIQGFGVYSGASLPAFVSLAARKGYRLVGTQSLGFNAFFVRNDVGTDLLPEVSAATCLDRPFVRWAMKELLPLVKDRDGRCGRVRAARTRRPYAAMHRA